ncbi:lipid-binding SYLF domain-containing protein [Corallococcus sp. EGB]|uniref:lipid-binding SYLF domain-containing protein n=1 Tax=Corallococcus sp. EGB TaxID=1521117 RepID=UPI001CBD5A17|nr:lipid-binding SYLF domain-containing protein [Corallococcus sp. EGB]
MTPEQEKTLHEDAVATVDRLVRKNPALEKELQQARGYAVFPSLGRASLVLGGSYGHGEVFEKGKPIGFATLSQLTIGVQVGGQTLSELIFFKDPESIKAFKGGKAAFAANASAVLVKAAASGTNNYAKCVAHAYSRGGMVLELSLGGQKFTFIPRSSDAPQQEHGGILERFRRKDSSEEQGAEDGAPRSRPQAAHPPPALTTGLTAAAMVLTRLIKAQASAHHA